MRNAAYLLFLLVGLYGYADHQGPNPQKETWADNVSAFFDFTILPEGTGDLVVAVTNDTCKKDLESWNNEWGVKRIVYNVESPQSLVEKLKEAGYGPNKKIGTLALSGHGCGNETHCFIKTQAGAIGSGMSDDEMKAIRELMADDGVVWLMGCHAGANYESLRRFAVKLQRTVVGNTGFVKKGNSGATGTWRVAKPD